ncbi:DSBA oxidoreductase [Caballeronia arvi]|uniref:DSBA oxidoreductase n=1 Tax=Caballeronia arvi TaxID=1777135 RepID=A0A158L0X3_9BURK|nr:DsbA family protein [Caballeronia arvi]SAL86649.1 DSBA oxidoreductase [Caballeronia arvi]
MDGATEQVIEVDKSASLTVDVHFDFVCPWCLIGKRNLDAAIRRLGSLRPDVSVEVRCHPHQLLPDIPAGGVPYQAFYVNRLGSAKAVDARRAQFRRPLARRACNWRSTGSK